MVSRPISQDKLDEVFQGGIIMELILFIYMLVIITVTIHILLVRENDVDGADAVATDDDAVAPDDEAVAPDDEAVAPDDDAVAPAARLVEWAEDGHMPAVPVHAADAVAPTDDLLPGEEEDHWEDLADLWEFPEIGKNDHIKYNRALRGCGRRGKGKQKGGKHIDKKKFRRADTKAHLSLA